MTQPVIFKQTVSIAIVAALQAIIPPAIVFTCLYLTSAWFADAYGLTETVSGDTFLDRDSTITKLGSVGRPCQYLEAAVWDENGDVLPAGEPGEGLDLAESIGMQRFFRDVGDELVRCPRVVLVVIVAQGEVAKFHNTPPMSTGLQASSCSRQYRCNCNSCKCN